MDTKKKKVRRVATGLRDQICSVLTGALEGPGTKHNDLPIHIKQFLSTAVPVQSSSSILTPSELEAEFFARYGSRDVEYLHRIDDFVQAIKLYGIGLLKFVKHSKSTLAGCDWDAIVLQESLTSEEALDDKEDRNENDPTRRPLQEIFEELELNGEARLIQCRRCKSWDVAFTRKQLRSLDEPETCKCKCRKCKRRWTEHS